jgi:hypothetical protein
LAISSINYLVKVAPDAQSAKGKLRAKNKKRRKNNNTTTNSNINNSNKTQAEEAEDINNCDGEVSPTDPLCEVYLSNGTKITLQCCVHGTVIELNHRLGGDGNEGGEEEANNVESRKRGGDNNASSSLLVTDPLLDGYLAVIMPNRGTYLPNHL